MEQKRILLVEDDQTIAELLAYNLRHAGYDVLQAYDGRAGLRMALSHDVDLALIDVMLPEVDGMTVTRDLSEAKPNLPIIVVTASKERRTVLDGFNSGADDFITKPFDLEELLARIAARLRRSVGETEQSPDAVRLDGITLDPDAHTLSSYDGQVRLKPKECELLVLLTSSPGRLYRREEIMRRVWNQTHVPTSRTLDVHVRQLRVHLTSVGSPVTIHNVRGVGYRIAPVNEP